MNTANEMPCEYFMLSIPTKAKPRKIKSTRKTEYHVHEIDENGDSVNVTFWDTKSEAMREAQSHDSVIVERVVYINETRTSDSVIYEH